MGGRQGKEALLRLRKGPGSDWVMFHSVLAATSRVVYNTACSVFLRHAPCSLPEEQGENRVFGHFPERKLEAFKAKSKSQGECEARVKNR